MANSSQLITIHRSTNAFEIMNFHNVLTEANIESYKVNCNTNYSYGVQDMELKVNEKDAEKALALLKNIQEK